jgi:hypothetical protein
LQRSEVRNFLQSDGLTEIRQVSQDRRDAPVIGFKAVGCRAQESVRATLEPDTNRVGILVMHVTNISSNTVRFLDIREGAGSCGEFYEITVEKDGNTYESKGNCLYAPGDRPKVVVLAPGKTYDRKIQPVAYVRREKHFNPPCEIKVTYRLSDKLKEEWKSKSKTVDLNLMFETNKIKLESSNK